MKRLLLSFVLVVSAVMAAAQTATTPQYCSTSGCSMKGPITGFTDKGGEKFNVKAYGAKGDGTTDDTAAINAAIAAETAAGGGFIFFPQGNYLTATCNFSITAPTVIQGVGQKSVEGSKYGSLITCTSSTNNLFNAATEDLVIQDIGIVGPTAGGETNYGVYFNGPNIHSRLNITRFSSQGFLDAININAGAYWSITHFYIRDPLRYGISVKNTLNNDEGDWIIGDGACVGYSHTNNATTPGTSACIAQFSSGGGKISKVKCNSSYTNCYYGNLAGSVQLLMVQNDFEASTNSPIYIAQGWPYITIVGNFLWTPANYPAIYGNAMQGYIIDGNDFESGGTTTAPAIQLVSSYNGMVGINHMHPNFPAQIYAAGGNNRDLSNLVTTSAPGNYANQDSLNIGCHENGCSGVAYLNFLEQNSGTTYDASIKADMNGNGGLTFKLPRDLGSSNIGYHFQPHGSATDFLYIDSATGAITTKNGTILDNGTTSPDMTLSANANLHLNAGRTFDWGSGGNSIQNDSGTTQNMHIDAAAKTGVVFVSGAHSTYGIVAYRPSPGGTVLGGVLTNGNQYIQPAGGGLILKDSGTGCHLITVNSSNVISAATVTCPY